MSASRLVVKQEELRVIYHRLKMAYETNLYSSYFPKIGKTPIDAIITTKRKEIEELAKDNYEKELKQVQTLIQDYKPFPTDSLIYFDDYNKIKEYNDKLGSLNKYIKGKGTDSLLDYWWNLNL